MNENKLFNSLVLQYTQHASLGQLVWLHEVYHIKCFSKHRSVIDPCVITNTERTVVLQLSADLQYPTTRPSHRLNGVGRDAKTCVDVLNATYKR